MNRAAIDFAWAANVSATPSIVLLALASYADERAEARLSMREIAGLTRLTDRSVRNAMRELERNRLVRRYEARGIGVITAIVLPAGGSR